MYIFIELELSLSTQMYNRTFEITLKINIKLFSVSFTFYTHKDSYLF